MKVLLFKEFNNQLHSRFHNKYYIGTNYLQCQLKVNDLIDISYYHNEYIELLKEFIINLDRYISSDLIALSHTFTANRYLTSACDRILNAYILIKLIGQSQGDKLLLVDSYDEKEIYVKFLHSNSIRTEYKPSITKLLISFIRRVKSLIRVFFNKINAVYITKRFTKHTPKINNTIFISWINNPNINELQLLKNNPYFGDMPSSYDEVSIISLSLEGVSQLKEIIKLINGLKIKVTPLFAYTKYWDILISVFKSFRILIPTGSDFIFDGVDFTPIIKKSLREDFWLGKLFSTITYLQTFKRLKNLIPGDIQFFYPFENQPWERTLLQVMRNLKSDIQLYGYQTFPLPKNLFIGYFSKKIISKGLFPTRILTSDYFSDELISRQGIKTLKLGSYRYSNLIKASAPKYKINNTNLVICSLFLEPCEALQLTIKSIDVTKRLNLNLMINYHPMLSPNIVEQIKHLCLNHAHVEVVDGPLVNYLSEAWLVLYNSSSVCFEAALRGIPIIFVSCEGIPDLNRAHFKVKSFRGVSEGELVIKRVLYDKLNYQDYSDYIYNQARDSFFIADKQKLQCLS
jgi:hypothetical protein